MMDADLPPPLPAHFATIRSLGRPDLDEDIPGGRVELAALVLRRLLDEFAETAPEHPLLAVPSPIRASPARDGELDLAVDMKDMPKILVILSEEFAAVYQPPMTTSWILDYGRGIGEGAPEARLAAAAALVAKIRCLILEPEE